ncbi:HNH endonuclease family protein [Streptomyces sp. NPDC047070]|uniref:HNH endonuclease family protein n=1 Tax=Streptomyces sp. NPDC047070 TaxID=3154923 RepID=UPI003455B30D
MLTFALRSLTAAALLALPLTAPAAAASARHDAHAPLPLAAAVELLPSATESREGYQRTFFKHWNKGSNPSDGCNTRAEVLIAESRVEPAVEAGCKIVAGEWYSYYDGVSLTAPGGLDIDHMVPLAEAWDSGASTWTAQRREAYANDQDAEHSLVAVSARSNRTKGDKDPADWTPPLADARCTYTAHWVATKLRWQLTVDDRERGALAELAAGCGQETVDYETAP